MIKIKSNDLLGLAAFLCFFAWQILAGSALKYILLAALIGLCILYSAFKKGNFLSVWFFALVFQKAIQRVISSGILFQAVTYLDEVTEIIAVIIIIRALAKKQLKLSKYEVAIGVAFSVYFAFCTVSTIVYSYMGIFLSVLDAFVCAKFMVFYFAGKSLIASKALTLKKTYDILNVPCKQASVILLLLALHDLIFPAFFAKYDFRFFTQSLMLGFQHPAYLAIVCLTIICVLALNMRYDQNNLKYIFMMTAVTILTFRSKEMAAVLIILLLYLLFVKYKFQGNALVLAPVAGLAIYFSSDQFDKYFTVHDYAPMRLKLIQDGVKIANQHFPFGSGFATFGTTVSYEYNSPFYQSLGYYSKLYIDQQVVADAFWHGIFAESGWLGSAAFIIAVLLMTFDSISKAKNHPYAGWCMLSIMLYSFIASIASTSFFNPAIAIMFIIYGIASEDTDQSFILNDTRHQIRSIKFKF